MSRIANLRSTHNRFLRDTNIKRAEGYLGWHKEACFAHTGTQPLWHGVRNPQPPQGHVAAACPHTAPRAWPPQANQAQPSLQLQSVAPFVAAEKQELLAVSLVKSAKGNKFLTKPTRTLVQLSGLKGWLGAVPAAVTKTRATQAKGVLVHTQHHDPRVGNSDSVPSWTPGTRTPRHGIFLLKAVYSGCFAWSCLHPSPHQQMQGLVYSLCPGNCISAGLRVCTTV